MKTKRVAKRSATRRPSKAAVVSDIFTVRDLGRQTQAVLAIVDTQGSARVQSRSGKKYVIRPESEVAEAAPSRAMFRERLASLRAQMREAGEGFTAEGWETFSKAVAGE